MPRRVCESWRNSEHPSRGAGAVGSRGGPCFRPCASSRSRHQDRGKGASDGKTLDPAGVSGSRTPTTIRTRGGARITRSSAPGRSSSCRSEVPGAVDAAQWLARGGRAIHLKSLSRNRILAGGGFGAELEAQERSIGGSGKQAVVATQRGRADVAELAAPAVRHRVAERSGRREREVERRSRWTGSLRVRRACSPRPKSQRAAVRIARAPCAKKERSKRKVTWGSRTSRALALAAAVSWLGTCRRPGPRGRRGVGSGAARGSQTHLR